MEPEQWLVVSKRVSDSVVHRLSLYLRVLESWEADGQRVVSSQELAGGGGATAAQVRKDLSVFGSFGKRGLGYSVPELADRIRSILGLEREWRVALVGAGRIGSALLEHGGFGDRGFSIVAVFDVDPDKVGRPWGGSLVRDVRELEEAIRDEGVQIVILAVPVEAVHSVMDRAIRAGARGVLNFAPTTLNVPEGVVVRDVNLMMELEALSFALSRGPDGE